MQPRDDRLSPLTLAKLFDAFDRVLKGLDPQECETVARDHEGRFRAARSLIIAASSGERDPAVLENLVRTAMNIHVRTM